MGRSECPTALAQIALTQVGATKIAAAESFWVRDEWMLTRKYFGVAPRDCLAARLTVAPHLAASRTNKVARATIYVRVRYRWCMWPRRLGWRAVRSMLWTSLAVRGVGRTVAAQLVLVHPVCPTSELKGFTNRELKCRRTSSFATRTIFPYGIVIMHAYATGNLRLESSL